jgi:hypothetical protein
VGAILGRSTTVSENNLIWFRADRCSIAESFSPRLQSHSQCLRSRFPVAPNGANAGGMSARPVQLNNKQLNKSVLPGALAGGISMKAKDRSFAGDNPTKTEYAIIFAAVIIFAVATYELFGG